jgi:hypothetical protein
MRYAQIKSGRKLHLVFEAFGQLSNPICGVKASNYRMTCNVPLGNSCHNCNRIYDANGGRKVKEQFLEALK